MPTELEQLSGVVETLHGIPVADPYRWLEDRNLPETEHWISEQCDRFDNYFCQIGPMGQLKQRVREYVDVETIDGVGKVRERYFYRKRRVRDQQASIFVKDSSTQTERILVDPSIWGPYTSVKIHLVSMDGTLLAYEVKQGGEHSKAIHVIAIDTGTPLTDHLERGLACGFAFSNRNNGFYYCHDVLDAPDPDHTVCFHRFGTAARDDLILLRLPRSRSSKLILSSAGEILSATLCHQHNGAAVLDYYLSRQDTDRTWQRVCRNVLMPFIPFFCRERLFARRFQEAPNGEIAELDSTSGVFVRLVVPEWHVPINHFVNVKDRFYVSYLVGVETVVRIWSFDGAFLGTLGLETGCTWRLLPPYTDDTNELFLHCESFTRPPMLFRCNPQTSQIVPWSLRSSSRSTAEVTTRQAVYCSKDGTEIKMSLLGLHEGTLALHDRPVIMTAYGGFGLTLTPQFSVFVSVMLELGFAFALPEIRGGGERGRPWHEAARGRNRQVAFDDFIAAAEWLCGNGLTAPHKLAIFGGSNSGILVGAAITQRPHLFRAALCIAPLLDMLRYHLFDRADGWAGEYGTSDDAEDFKALFAYSPYHHIEENINYPAVLFVTGDQDTRCNPAHARKMAARLAGRPVQSHAILLDHSVERGHAPTMPLDVRIEGLTNRIAFLCRELGIPIPEEVHNDVASS